MRHHFIAACVATATLGCATAQESKCVPEPKDLIVKELEPGSGEALAFRSGAMVFYSGWLYDGCAKDFKGEMFDSNVDKMVPFGLIVGAGRVIKGWDEGLMGLKKGGKRLLIIPADKSYGSTARGKIPANAPLVFEVKLVDLRSPPPPRQPASAPEK